MNMKRTVGVVNPMEQTAALDPNDIGEFLGKDSEEPEPDEDAVPEEPLGRVDYVRLGNSGKRNPRSQVDKKKHWSFKELEKCYG